MRKLQNKAFKRSLGGAAVFLLLTASFQNCGKAGFDSELETAEQASQGSDPNLTNKYGYNHAQKVENIPFAFDTGFDTISYNSCSYDRLPNESQKGGFYTLKAGAYTSKGGLRLNDDFMGYIEDTFAPTYPNVAITRDEIKEYLADSPVNKGTQPVVGIRNSNNLLSGAEVPISAGVRLMQVPLVSNLTSGEILETLVSESVYNSFLAQGRAPASLNPYFNLSTEMKNFETSILFNSSEVSVSSLMNQLGNAGSRLIIGFKNPESTVEQDLLNPDTGSSMKTMTKAYGKAYKFNVSTSNFSNHFANPSNVLSSVQETDLLKQSTVTSGWTCDPRKALMVVRQQDANADPTLCPAMTISQMETYRRELSVIRRHLPADKWLVNLSRTIPCAVPIAGVSCYNEATNINKEGVKQVEYDLTKECFQASKSTGYESDSNIPKSKCANFISFCEKN